MTNGSEPTPIAEQRNQQAVNQLCARLASRLGPTKFDLWFDEEVTQFLFEASDSTLHIKVPSRFHADWIDQNFKTEIDSSTRELFGREIRVAYDVDVDLYDAATAPRSRNDSSAGQTEQGGQSRDSHSLWANPPGDDSPQNSGSLNDQGRNLGLSRPPSPDTSSAGDWRNAPTKNDRSTSRNTTTPAGKPVRRPRLLKDGAASFRYDDRYDLARFIVGPGNELTYHAALQLVADDQAFSPLCLHGGCGLGKTHLLQGICRRYAATHPGATIRYMTGEAFTNEYIRAIRSNSLDDFRKKMRRLELLAIDDVHFLSNKNATQNEFLATFDAIGLSGARIVLASDNHPKHIDALHQRLVSRMMSGMVVEIRVPCQETRAKIVRQLALRRGVSINDAAVNAVAERCVGSVREIEGVLTRLHAMHTLLHQHGSGVAHQNGEGVPIGLILVNQLLQTESLMPTRPVPVREIIAECARRCQVTTEQVLGKSRHQRVVLARSLASYLARQLTTMSYPEIARSLAKKNHSTVLAAVKRVDKMVKDDVRVNLSLQEGEVSVRYAIDTLKSSIISNTKRCH